MAVPLKDWSKPTTVDAVTSAFPAQVIGNLLPMWEDIPKEFHDETPKNEKWFQFQRDWFFKGINPTGLKPKEGIDKEMAIRHLSACQRSFQPKHEHKEAGVAWLASLWFEEDSTWEVGAFKPEQRN